VSANANVAFPLSILTTNIIASIQSHILYFALHASIRARCSVTPPLAQKATH
jgi:hypothetical protein